MVTFVTTITGHQPQKGPFALLFGCNTLTIPALGPHLMVHHRKIPWMAICFLVAKKAILKQWISTPPMLADIKQDLTLLLYRERLDQSYPIMHPSNAYMANGASLSIRY